MDHRKVDIGMLLPQVLPSLSNAERHFNPFPLIVLFESSENENDTLALGSSKNMMSSDQRIEEAFGLLRARPTNNKTCPN